MRTTKNTVSTLTYVAINTANQRQRQLIIQCHHPGPRCNQIPNTIIIKPSQETLHKQAVHCSPPSLAGPHHWAQCVRRTPLLCWWGGWPSGTVLGEAVLAQQTWRGVQTTVYTVYTAGAPRQTRAVHPYTGAAHNTSLSKQVITHAPGLRANSALTLSRRRFKTSQIQCLSDLEGLIKNISEDLHFFFYSRIIVIPLETVLQEPQFCIELKYLQSLQRILSQLLTLICFLCFAQKESRTTCLFYFGS